MYLKFLRDRSGSALPMVLIVFVVLLLLGVALLQLSLSDTRQAAWQSSRVQAHYYGRSGVEHGIRLLENKLTSETYTGTIMDLCASLQASVIGSYSISGNGSYTIQFSEGNTAGEIKITAVGTVAGLPDVSQTVTYTRLLGTMYDYTDPSGVWMTGINLEKGIQPTDPGESFLGHAILLESKNSKSYIQSPKGSTNPSTYQASVVLFRDYEGRSLRQITNSINLTFDSEIVFFIGDIKLNKNDTPIVLQLSPDVVKQHTWENNSSFPNPFSSPPIPAALNYQTTEDTAVNHVVGFESHDRREAFVGHSYSPAGPVPPEGADLYGIVKLGGGVLDDDENPITTLPAGDTKGYYYYKSGVDLQDINSGDLIPIDDDDDIVEALDSFLGVNMGSDDPLWNDH